MSTGNNKLQRVNRNIPIKEYAEFAVTSKTEPVISIIVPVYNTERYIKSCVESIISQSFEDFELIFVDDGSSDNSYNIIDSFVVKDQRIKLVHQNNAGVSAARNSGLKHAKGDYVVFIDSDDTISCDYLEILYQSITDSKADIVFSGISYVDNGIETNRVILEEGMLHLNSEIDLLVFFNTPLLTSPVSKIYKKDIIRANDLQFDTSLSFAEDKDFNLKYFQYIQNACVISFCGYFYRNVYNSLSKKKYDYEYRIEHKHWQIKKVFFESQHDFGIREKTYLVNQLFYIMYDEMAYISSSSNSIEEMSSRWSKAIKYVDLPFLSSNYGLLAQPIWMKVLVKMGLYKIIFCILKFRIKANNGETSS